MIEPENHTVLAGPYLPNSFPKAVRTLCRAWRESRAA